MGMLISQIWPHTAVKYHTGESFQVAQVIAVNRRFITIKIGDEVKRLNVSDDNTGNIYEVSPYNAEWERTVKELQEERRGGGSFIENKKRIDSMIEKHEAMASAHRKEREGRETVEG